MPSTFSCPRCSQQYTWSAEVVGRQMRCQRCGHVFAIPGQAVSPGPVQSPLGPASPLGAGSSAAAGSPLAGGGTSTRPTRLSDEDKAFVGFGGGFAGLALLSLLVFRLTEAAGQVFPILALVLALLGAAMLVFGLRGKLAMGIPAAAGVVGAALVVYFLTAGGSGGSSGPAPAATGGDGAGAAAAGAGPGGTAPLSPVERARLAAARSQSSNNLKQLALGMHNYQDTHRQFPLPGSLGPDGKPLLSWRVHLLPFLDQAPLYSQFHLNEPWDSPHNKTLIDRMPSVYRHPVSKVSREGRTNYVVPVGNGAIFDAEQPTRFADIRDGTSNTLMIVEVDDEHAPIWTKPDDLPFDPSDPGKWLSRAFEGGFNAALGDGSTRHLKLFDKPDMLRILFTRAGGEPVGFF